MVEQWVAELRIVHILVFYRGCESHRSAFRTLSLVRPPGSGQPSFPDDWLHKYQTSHPRSFDRWRGADFERCPATPLKATPPRFSGDRYRTPSKLLSFSHGGRT